MTDEYDDVCGETFDHDLPDEEPVDGILSQTCRTCDAEIITELGDDHD